MKTMETTFALVDRIIPYTLMLIGAYMIIILAIVFLSGCSPEINTCIRDKRYFAPAAKQEHSERTAKFMKEKVNHLPVRQAGSIRK